MSFTSNSLAALVANAIADYGGALERLVFGTDDPHSIESMFVAWTRERLDAQLVAAHWYRASVGAVVGATVDDARTVVVKVLPARYSRRYLLAARRVQAHVATRGFPAPRPIGDPSQLGPSLAMSETMLDDPGASLPPPGARAHSAGALARLTVLAAEMRPADTAGLAPHPLDSANSDALYPEPHSPVFDFTIDDTETRRIDALAADARRVRALDTSSPVVAHTDFSARNVRLTPAGVRAVYDWDSIALVTESVAVGQAAITWNALAEPGEDLAPAPEAVAAYVADYEAARGAPFTSVQRSAAGAAALYTLCYTARCEVSLGAAAGHRRAGERLRLDGPRYLHL